MNRNPLPSIVEQQNQIEWNTEYMYQRHRTYMQNFGRKIGGTDPKIRAIGVQVSIVKKWILKTGWRLDSASSDIRLFLVSSYNFAFIRSNFVIDQMTGGFWNRIFLHRGDNKAGCSVTLQQCNAADTEQNGTKITEEVYCRTVEKWNDIFEFWFQKWRNWNDRAWRRWWWW